MSANQLSLQCLREFAPANSPILAYRIEQSGNPMNDWARHVSRNPLFRRELEENSVLGNVVVRAVEGDETFALDRVKILSLAYATRFFEHLTDAKEFVRCVKSIADADATQFELEQIASHYYRECRQRPVSEVLKEMALLGMEMTRVTATVNDLEIEATETEIEETKLTSADEKRIRESQQNLPPLPVPTPHFDDEMQAVKQKLSRHTMTKAHKDEFANFYLTDEGKSLEQLDEDFARFETHEQYDEDGLLGLQMSGSQRAEVVLELDGEITAEYLPELVQPVAKQLQLVFVGHQIGGRAAQAARHFVACRQIETADNVRARECFRAGIEFVETPLPNKTEFCESPLTRDEIFEWIDLQLDAVYNREVVRSARRFTTSKNGERIEFLALQTVNPDFEEKQYASQILGVLLDQMERDFHFVSLRRNAIYQTIYLQIRSAKDTAVLAKTAETARAAKDEKRLSLKEYTALATVAKSQFARLADCRPSPALYRLMQEINRADSRKIRYFKWAMYGANQPSHPIHDLPKQEVAKAWTTLKEREQFLKETTANQHSSAQAQRWQKTQIPARRQVKIVPTIH